MTDNDKKLISKEVGLSAAIGAGLGLTHGLKNNKPVSNALLGAGIGALVGIFGQSLLNDTPSKNIADPVTDNKQE